MTPSHPVLALINLLPAPAWNVIAALIALSGVMLTIWVQGKRLAAQFQHDRGLKDRDREMSMRKEIYLAAAEAIAVGIHSLGNFNNVKVPTEDLLKDYLGKVPALAKTYVIATVETVQAINGFTNAMTSAHLKLQLLRAPLIEMHSALLDCDKMLARAEKDRDEMLDLIRRHRIDLEDSGPKFEVLNEHFDFAQKQIESISQKRQQLAIQLQRKQMEMITPWRAENAEVSRVLIPVIVSIRKELNLPIDEANLRIMIEASISRISLAHSDFIKSVTSPVQSALA